MIAALRTRFGAVLAALVIAGGAAVQAIGSLNGAATVTEPAERGVAVQVTDTIPPPAPRYRVPVADVAAAGWSDTHSSYPATDVFVRCGADLVSPVDGIVTEVRRTDRWDPAVDDPATRGGRTVSIVGQDGVRYYLAHFDTITSGIEAGTSVAAGQRLGTMGDTGRTSACHLHFAISPPCPTTEWWVRRGVVWPYPYLDAWRDGEQRSPAAEVGAWEAANPDACTTRPGT